MNLIYKLFHMDSNKRDDIITMTSGMGIVVNVLMSMAKLLIGVMAHSIAIISEGMNNITDALSAVLTLVGAKLAGKHPDEKHPFGYGRIEYLVSLIISVLIVVTGVEMLTSSVKMIFEPEELKVSYLALAVIFGSAVIKFFFGSYTEKMGKKADSGALIGVGVESKSDSFASVITIASTVIFLVFHFSLDAYAGIITSALILKAGFELLRDTIADLLGRPGDHDLAMTLYKEIRSTDGVLAAVDMMLHNYGPDAWSGSVNVEMDHKKSVGEIYQILHDLQLRIMYEYHVVMVFGIYAVDNDHEEVKAIRKSISSFVQGKEHVKSFHALYISERENKIYCDFIVDYKLKDWEELKGEFTSYMATEYPNYGLELTIETEFV